MSSNGKFLNSIYRDETITSIIEEAINGSFQLTFIDNETGIERVLTRGDLASIRDKGFSKKAEVGIEQPSSRRISGSDGWPGMRKIVSFGHRQNVGYSDLRASENTLELVRTKFGGGDKGKLMDNLEFHIAPLTPKEIEKRTFEIKNKSMEQRSEAIRELGVKYEDELSKKHSDITFKQPYIANLIWHEEKPIYELLNKEVPKLTTYLKHLRKKVK